MKLRNLTCLMLFGLLFARAKGADFMISSLADLAKAASGENAVIRMKPGVYPMAEYLTETVLADIRKNLDPGAARPPVPMLILRGNNNRIDLNGVTIEIDTALYKKLPQGGYTRCIIVSGKGNHIDGLTLRNTGENHGSGGNMLSLEGDGNTVENTTLHVHGSFPWGYGDLLGKGGPNLVVLEKQSGIQVLGSRSVLKRCKVFSRAFGHCFYIQDGNDILLEDCYAEGSVRATTDMLADRSGPAFEQGFRSVYRNRDGRFAISPGYVKSLSEDGYRTYGGAGSVTLRNCTAVHTRAGFEIGARDDAKTKTIVENCIARGCERAFLIGSHTLVRRCRGDIAHGPLLYLRGGLKSDVELELIGDPPESLVQAIATIAGDQHRVRLSAQASFATFPSLPIFVGFGMPPHAEMASPIDPAPARNIDFKSTISFGDIITGGQMEDCIIEASGRVLSDLELRKDPGPWDLPPNGIANGQSRKKE